MKTKFPFIKTLAAIMVLFAVSASVRATPLYWDTNGTVSGFGSSFGGSWNGVATNWNSDPTGGSAGILTATTSSSDSLSFVGGGATALVDISGNQAAGSLDFANTANIPALRILNGGSLAVAGAITDTGAGGSRIDVVNSTQANAASILTTTSLTVDLLNLNATTGGAQFWTTNYNMTIGTLFGIGAVNNSATFRQTGGTATFSSATYGLGLAAEFATNPASGTSTYVLDGGTIKAARIGTATANGDNNTTNRYAGTGVLEFNGGTIQNLTTNSTLNIQNGSAFGSYNGTGTKDMQMNTSKPVTLQLSQNGTHTFNADGAGGQIIVSPSAQIVDKSGEAGTLEKTGLGTLVFTGGGSTAVNSWTGNTTATAGKIMTDYSIIAGQAASGGTDSLSNAYSASSRLIFNGANFELKGRSSAGASSATGVTLPAGTGILGYTVTVASTAGLVVGQAVTNANLPAGTYIRRILNGTQIELNAMSTATTAQSGQTLNFGAASFANTQTVNDVELRQAGTATTVTVTPASGTSTTLLAFGNVTGTGGFTKAGTGTLSLTGSLNYTGPTVVSAGTLNFAPVSGTSTLTGNITGTGAITKTGAGTTIINAATQSGNTFNGSVVVDAGTLQFGIGDGTQIRGLSSASSYTVNAGATIATARNAMNPAASITLNGGTLKNLGSGGNFQILGALVMNGGTLEANNGQGSAFQSFALNNDVTVGGNSTSFIQAGTAANNGIHLAFNSAAGANRTFDVADATAGTDLSVSARLLDSSHTGNSANLIKTGNGTMALSANNSYTGTTTVSAGTLVISSGGSIGNGAVAVNGGTMVVNGTVGNGGVTVGNGATLGGNGTIGGSLTVNSGGTLAPGNSPGIISTGNFALGSGGILSMEINGPATPVAGGNYDQVNVTGSIALDGNLTLSLTGGYTATHGNLYFLINNDGVDAITSGFANVNGGSLSNNTEFTLAGERWFISYAADFTAGTFTGGNDVAIYAIPEPATWMLVAGSLAGVMILRRRKI